MFERLKSGNIECTRISSSSRSKDEPLWQSHHPAISSKVLFEAALVLPDIATVVAQFTAVLANRAIVLVNVDDIQDRSPNVAVAEVFDESVGILPTLSGILAQFLPILVALNFITNEATGVAECAGVADGGNGQRCEDREHVRGIGLHRLYSIVGKENSSRAMDNGSGPRDAL